MVERRNGLLQEELEEMKVALEQAERARKLSEQELEGAPVTACSTASLPGGSVLAAGVHPRGDQALWNGVSTTPPRLVVKTNFHLA